jgi:8-oxo-dGTP pyrophosphatase MutT (NUDIX family)
MDSKKFIDTFSEIVKAGLPGEQAHAEVMPVSRKFTSDALKSATSLRQSAVGVILYPQDATINSVLIQRPSYEGTHSNQVSFPGGKMDETDHDLEFTARRECFEEIDLPMGFGNRIGELTNVYIPVSNFRVQPYIFYVDDLPPLTPDAREVDSIISFDVFELIKEETLKSTNLRMSQGFIQKDVPYYDINGHVVWGATAMMLSELKAILKQF